MRGKNREFIQGITEAYMRDNVRRYVYAWVEEIHMKEDELKDRIISRVMGSLSEEKFIDDIIKRINRKQLDK